MRNKSLSRKRASASKSALGLSEINMILARIICSLDSLLCPPRGDSFESRLKRAHTIEEIVDMVSDAPEPKITISNADPVQPGKRVHCLTDNRFGVCLACCVDNKCNWAVVRFDGAIIPELVRIDILQVCSGSNTASSGTLGDWVALHRALNVILERMNSLNERTVHPVGR